MKNRMQGISTKVTASTIGAAISTLLVWVFETYVDPDVAVPVGVVGAVTVLFTFTFGFLMPENTPIESSYDS